MNEEQAKKLVRRILEKGGFIVCQIERCDRETPDFAFNFGSETYVLELKQKQSDPRQGEKMRRNEETGWKIYVTADATGHRNRFAAIIAKAASQMMTVSGDPLRVLWFFGEGRDAAFYQERLFATLYGAKDVVWVAENQSELTTVECLYADYAEFEICKDDLDGVIASVKASDDDDIELHLYMNDRSPRYDRIRESRLAQMLSPSVFDPQLEDGRRYLLIDLCDKKPSEADVHAAIAAKYRGHVLKVLNFNRHYAEVYVPVAAESDTL